MGFLSSSVSFTKYMVKDQLPDNFWSTAIEEISARAFREKDAGVQETSIGWAPSRDPFKEEITLEDISFSEFLIVALRVDKRSVPAPLLKKYCSIEERRTLQERQMERLTSKMRKEIRERTKLRLLAKALPVPATYDMCWNISTGSVLFFSRQDKICGMFEDLFKTTFGTRIYPVIPYTIGLQIIDRETQQEAYETMKPEVFV